MGFPEDLGLGIEEDQTSKNGQLTQEIEKNAQIEMDENTFWSIVKRIGWGEKSNIKGIYDVEETKLKGTLSNKELFDLRAIHRLAWNLLDKVVGEDRNPAGGGDDSHGDLISHIVGLGREQFYAHLNDYSLIEARGSAPYGTPEGYKERFSYCLPHVHNPVEEKEYDVTIQATVTKTIRVTATNEDHAVEEAHMDFCTAPTEEAENYEEETLKVEEVS